MVTARTLSKSDERHTIGQWFESMTGLVEEYPTRIGTAASKKIEYTRNIVSTLSRTFNPLGGGGRQMSEDERATAAKHVYKLGATTKWDEKDDHQLEAGKPAADASKEAVEMFAKMKRLYEVCKSLDIGLSIHTPEPGLIQIDFVPQMQRKLEYKIKPPKMTFGNGF